MGHDSPGSAESSASGDPAGPNASTAQHRAPGDKDGAGDETATNTVSSGTDALTAKDETIRAAPPGVVVGTGGFNQDVWVSRTAPRRPAIKNSYDRAAAKPTKPRSAPPESKHGPARDRCGQSAREFRCGSAIAADESRAAADRHADCHIELARSTSFARGQCRDAAGVGRC